MSPDFLRWLASHKGWSIYRLSKESGISHPALYCYLNGKKPLSVPARRKLAALFPEQKHIILTMVIPDVAA